MANKTVTVTAHNVDLTLLRHQSRSLAEIAAFLTDGEPSPNAEDWPDAIEGLQNLIAALIHSTEAR